MTNKTLVDDGKVVGSVIDVRTVRNIMINELNFNREALFEIAKAMVDDRLSKINIEGMVQLAVNRACQSTVNNAVRPEELRKQITTNLQQVLAEQIVISVTTKQQSE